jgi:hypothetical protein
MSKVSTRKSKAQKKTSSRKLTLKKRSLRRVDAAALEGAQGGAFFPPPSVACPTVSCEPCHASIKNTLNTNHNQVLRARR